MDKFDKKELKKLNKDDLLLKAEEMYDELQVLDVMKVKNLEAQIKILGESLNKALVIARGVGEANQGLLQQIDGAYKNNSKLHNVNMKELETLIKSLQAPQK